MTVKTSVPTRWNEVLLDAVATRGSGHTPDKKIAEYWNGQIKWISLTDSWRLDNLYIDDTTTKTTPEGIRNSSAVIHPTGTVILSRDAGVGKSGIMMEDMACSQHFMAWECGINLNNIFLYYWLQTKKRQFENVAAGNTIKTIGLPYFKKLKIMLPSRHEQDEIIRTLRTWDGYIENLLKIVNLKKKIKKGLMQNLLTGKRRLHGFRDGWKTKKIQNVFETKKGSDLSKEKLNNSGQYECILYGELYTTYNEIINTVKSKTNIREGTMSKIGDILIPASTTTVAIDLAIAASLNRDNVLIGGDINLLRPKKEMDSRFFAYYLTYAKKHDLARLAQGVTIIHLYGSDLKNVNIEVPSLPEQTAIANILTAADQEIETLEKKKALIEQQKKFLLDNLITGKLRLPGFIN